MSLKSSGDAIPDYRKPSPEAQLYRIASDVEAVAPRTTSGKAAYVVTKRSRQHADALPKKGNLCPKKRRTRGQVLAMPI